MKVPQPSRPERRRARHDPEAQLTAADPGLYPVLRPRAWYPLHVGSGADDSYIWLETGNGLTRVKRKDVQVRGRRW